MSDPRKYLLGATATVVAARIQARATGRQGGPGPVGDEPALEAEFLEVYRSLERAFNALGPGDEHERAQKPYAEKKKRENTMLQGD